MLTLIRAGGMRGAAEILRRNGVAIEPLLDHVRIPHAALNDEELRISLSAYAKLLELASDQAGCPDLGLQIGDLQDISILGPLAIAMQNASTVGEAMQICSRFLHAHSNGIQVNFRSNSPASEYTTLRLSLVLPSWQPNRQLMDLSMADLFHFITFLASAKARTLRVTLPHSPKATPQRYVRSFGPNVTFEQPHGAVIVPSALLQQNLEGAVSELHRISLEYLRLAFSDGGQSISAQVEGILQRALSSTRGRRNVIAKLLHMHPRTLQRRLKAEGTSYSALLEGVRREQALHWLTESDAPLAHVADILGLADQSVLCRSCGRWFGRSPRAIRGHGAPADI